MTYTKTILFASLIVAMILPFSIMDSSAQSTETKQIQKPTETRADIDTKQKVLELFDERISLKDEKIQKEEQSARAISPIDNERYTERLTQIQNRMSEISGEMVQINADARELFAMTSEDKIFLLEQKQMIRDSKVPYYGLGTDMRVGALTIGFQSQEIADKYIPKLDRMLDVPYYIDIHQGDVDRSCLSKTANCDPLMGGIEIGTQKPSGWTTCTISVPMNRNTSGGGTEAGFVTAAHCFGNTNGNDAKQPSGGSKVGDVTVTQNSEECDCAFVTLSSSESTIFGTYAGADSSNQLLSKSDALSGAYVVMYGKSSGAKVGQVIDIAYDTTTTPSIKNTHKISYEMAGGDSGGTVIDSSTYSVYHGLIKGSNTSGYSFIIPWSHIDAALDLQ